MTNFEKYYSEIKNIVPKGRIAKHNEKLIQCKTIECTLCDFDREKITCDRVLIRWLCEEYKEPIRLTAKEKAFLSIVETGWIARDELDISLCWYSEKPIRKERIFVIENGEHFRIADIFNLFNFIKWEDEPYSVEEMLTWEVEE